MWREVLLNLYSSKKRKLFPLYIYLAFIYLCIYLCIYALCTGVIECVTTWAVIPLCISTLCVWLLVVICCLSWKQAWQLCNIFIPRHIFDFILQGVMVIILSNLVLSFSPLVFCIYVDERDECAYCLFMFGFQTACL